MIGSEHRANGQVDSKRRRERCWSKCGQSYKGKWRFLQQNDNRAQDGSCVSIDVIPFIDLSYVMLFMIADSLARSLLIEKTTQSFPQESCGSSMAPQPQRALAIFSCHTPVTTLSPELF